NPEIPQWLQEIILRCMEVDPDKRFATAAQLAFALQNPAQTVITERGRREKPDGAMTVFRRWLRSRNVQRQLRPRIAERIDSSPIVMAAVDLSSGVDALGERVRVHARRALDADPQARLTCITVLKTAILSLETGLDEKGNNIYVQRLVELKDWARPLGVDDDRISVHVLEAVDPASALIDYARHNHVDHIVIGARASSALRRYLGSVSAQVVAEAPCTVTVVRA
ncbi:MAG: universal stress protein, partial [Alsobacter sp.]